MTSSDRSDAGLPPRIAIAAEATAGPKGLRTSICKRRGSSERQLDLRDDTFGRYAVTARNGDDLNFIE
jgi:hypothetical protein